MSLKSILTAAVFTAASSVAIAQTAQQTQPQTNPLRPTQPTQPAQPAQPTAPARPTTPAPQAQQPAPAARPAPAPAAPAQAQRPAAQGTLVNLNTAPAEELDKLPQIGAARAQAIIAKRPYRDWNDFVAKDVVPKNAEEAIRDKVRFR